MTKGFTLIELLIVIAILAILGTAVYLVLNPAQRLAEARDSQRMTDFANLTKALSLYLTSTTTTSLIAGPRTEADVSCGFASGCPVAAVSGYAINGTGWVGANFKGLAVPPLATLPRDPVGNVNYHYAYKSNGAAIFSLNCRLESVKYRDKMVNDGGDKSTCGSSYVDTTCWYEVGNSLSL